MTKLIYFDSAATSYPKPKSVVRAITRCLVYNGGNPGRSSHILSLNAANAVYSCREEICSLFGFEYPENVIFTYNTTYALNFAIKGLYKKNSRIIVSNLEHNSVLRPVHALSEDKDLCVQYDVFDATGSDEEVILSFKEKLYDNTSLAVVTMASNVCGKILPVSALSKICHDNGTKIIVDCAQSAGCVPFTFDGLGADVLCMPSHKSLYGIQGCGICIFAKDIEPCSIIEGGNGVNSLLLSPQASLPEKLEVGTCATPAISALCAGIKHIKGVGINEIFEYNSSLCDYLCDGLHNIEGISIYGESKKRGACVLFNKNNEASEQLAQALSEDNICTRAGVHCAPLAHIAFGTQKRGAVRASLSFGNTKKEIDAFLMKISKKR